ncbi:MAG: glutathione S-transferase C-terminal domain-containing protein [Beijerinckiaceae bacterium]|nr:glutathione S-transferase C-terminal domain-containing protein [Beijerinckiaceae bacterium]MCI0736323.1 glutathione S-transferase C-terminal domain-containing protein [Beijerinckiaceae bacterium]
MRDDGFIAADSTFIRLHIEKKYGVDFDAGLTPQQRAAAWAIEKMCEEHLYMAMLSARWLDDANFAKGTSPFFAGLSMPLRQFLPHIIRGKYGRLLRLQGFGRHTRAEQTELAVADINALATLLGDKPVLMGDRPCGADASVFGFVVQLLLPDLPAPLRTAAEKHENLFTYRDRILARYFPG